MNHAIPSDLAAAYRQCQNQAFGHYENFPVASLLLARKIRPHVAALYAFARTADDFADEDQFKGRRLKEINRWEKGLRDALKGKPAPEPLLAFAHTLQVFSIPLSLPLDLLRAFRMDAVNHRYSNWNSLLDYCRHSANPVGRMVLMLHGLSGEKLFRCSDDICTGLQLINFWQDTSVDLKRGRLYYPREKLKRFRVREKDLGAMKDSPGFRALVRKAVEDTEIIYRRGLPLLDAVPGRLKLELRATYLGGLGILHKIRGMDYNVLGQRPVLNSADKMLLVLKTILNLAPH